MSKKSRFRGAFDEVLGKREKRQFNDERQNLYYIYWSRWRQLGLKKSPWVRSKIIWLFVKPLTADDKYSLFKRGNLLQNFQMSLSESREFFFFLDFLNLDAIFNILEKKMILTSDVFLNLHTPKYVVK